MGLIVSQLLRNWYNWYVIQKTWFDARRDVTKSVEIGVKQTNKKEHQDIQNIFTISGVYSESIEQYEEIKIAT